MPTEGNKWKRPVLDGHRWNRQSGPFRRDFEANWSAPSGTLTAMNSPYSPRCGHVTTSLVQSVGNLEVAASTHDADKADAAA